MPKNQAEIRYKTIVIETDDSSRYLDSQRFLGKSPFSSWDAAIRWLQQKRHALNESSRFHFEKIKEEVAPLTMSEEIANKRFELIQKIELPPKATYKGQAVVWKPIGGVLKEEGELVGVS